MLLHHNYVCRSFPRMSNERPPQSRLNLTDSAIDNFVLYFTTTRVYYVIIIVEHFSYNIIYIY